MIDRLKQLTVGTRLVMGFSVMIVFLVIVGLSGFQSVKHINGNLSDIFNVRLPSMDYLIEADRDLQQLLVSERSMIFAATKSDIFKDLVGAYEENLQQADERWNKYKALATSPEEQAIIPHFEQAREDWKVISRKVVDGRLADTRQGRREALDLTLGIANTKFEQMRDHLDQLTETELPSTISRGVMTGRLKIDCCQLSAPLLALEYIALSSRQLYYRN